MSYDPNGSDDRSEQYGAPLPPSSTPPPGSVPPPDGGYGSPRNSSYGSSSYGSSSYGSSSYGPPGQVPSSWESQGYGDGSGQQAQLANYGARLAGFVIDSIIVFVGFGILTLLTHWVKVTKGLHGAPNHVHIDPILLIVQPLAVILYGTLMCGSRSGQTVGMKASRVKVVNASDWQSPIGYGKALGRAVVEYVLGAGAAFSILLAIPWVVDMLFPIWDRMNQTLHDKAMSTVVVKI